MLSLRCDCIWTDVLQTYVCLCPCESSHFQPRVYMHISSQVYMNHIIDTLVYETQLCNSHLSVPLRELTLRTFLFAYIYSKVYTYHVIDTFVYEPMLCELTYVRALSNAHTLNLVVYYTLKILANIHISYDRYFVYELKFCEFTYVSAVASPHFGSSLYTSTYLQIYIYHSIDTRVCIWAHAVQTHICFCPCECSHLEPLCIHQFC